jgi:MFS family permease
MTSTVTPRPLTRQPAFVRLWAGQTISQFGTQVSLLALPLLAIVVLQAEPYQVGLLTAVEFLPFLLIGLPAGVWVDRLRRRPILIAADLARAAALVSIPVAHVLGVLSLPQLFLVAFGMGVLTVFFDVAYHAYLPGIIDRDQLIEGNSKLEMSASGAAIAGPGLAGALVQLVTAPVAIAVDAVSYVASALFVLWIRAPEPATTAAAAEARPSMRAEVAEGLRFVLRNPYIRSVLVSATIMNLFSSMGGAVLLIYAVRELRLDPGTLGVILALGNVGVLAGAVFASRFRSRLGAGPALIWSLIGSGLGYLLIPLTSVGPIIPLAVAGLAIATFFGIIFNINQLSLRQAVTPDRLRGRMTATVRFVAWSTLPFGSVVGGVLGSTIGLLPTLWIAAVGIVLSTLPIAFSPLRGLREIPALPNAGSTAGSDPVLPGTDPAPA